MGEGVECLDRGKGRGGQGLGGGGVKGGEDGMG